MVYNRGWALSLGRLTRTPGDMVLEASLKPRTERFDIENECILETTTRSVMLIVPPTSKTTIRLALDTASRNEPVPVSLHLEPN